MASLLLLVFVLAAGASGINGQGEALWACKAAGHDGGCPSGATSLEVLKNSRDVVAISRLTSSVDSEGGTVQDLKIIAPAGSGPNMDEIHVQASSHVAVGQGHGIWCVATMAVVLTVDQTGKGDYRTIQEAINAVPARANNSITRININPGIYTEKVVVNKAGISLIGRSATSTIIQWTGPWDTKHQSEIPLHVLGTDFVAAKLTFKNLYGPGKPALAAKVEADRASFYECSFISFQDTLLDATGRHYYRGCYIEGATDFIFGSGKAFFERCHLHSTSHVGGAFTAQRRCTESENAGFSFFRCQLTGSGVATAILGRPWGPYAIVVFAQCDMSNAVKPVGWDDWGYPERESTAFFGQFRCSGPGSATQGRVKWAHNNLSRKEAEPFLTIAWVNGTDWIRAPQ